MTPTKKTEKDKMTPTKKTEKDKMTPTKKTEKDKKKTHHFSSIFLFAVVLVIGVGLGYYLSTTPGVDDTTTTTTLEAVGNDVATTGKIVKVDYIGKFLNGTVFDTSLEEEAKLSGIYQEGRPYQPLTFSPGSGQVIEGFEEAVIGMKIGEEVEVTIPPEKAYSSGPLAGETLIFKIWVRGISNPVTVQLTIVNDPDCGAECDTTRIVGITQQVFSEVVITEVDSNSDEGQLLIEKYDIIFLPTYLLSSNIVDSENYAGNSMAFEKNGDSYVIKADISGATRYANAEAQKKAEEEEKKNALDKCASIEKTEKPEFDAFVVSYCPFGVQMQRIMIPVAEALGETATLKARYMGSVVDNKVTAMHGDQEAQENLLQICIREEQTDKYWDYVACFIQEGKTNECLTETSIDQTKLSTCLSDVNKGVKYAQEDFDLQDTHKVTGSPTLILNGARANEFDFGGRSAEAVKSLICCSFTEKPLACDETLDTRSATTSFSQEYASGAASGGSC